MPESNQMFCKIETPDVCSDTFYVVIEEQNIHLKTESIPV